MDWLFLKVLRGDKWVVQWCMLLRWFSKPREGLLQGDHSHGKAEGRCLFQLSLVYQYRGNNFIRSDLCVLSGWENEGYWVQAQPGWLCWIDLGVLASYSLVQPLLQLGALTKDWNYSHTAWGCENTSISAPHLAVTFWGVTSEGALSPQPTWNQVLKPVKNAPVSDCSWEPVAWPLLRAGHSSRLSW